MERSSLEGHDTWLREEQIQDRRVMFWTFTFLYVVLCYYSGAAPNLSHMFVGAGIAAFFGWGASIVWGQWRDLLAEDLDVESNRP